MVCLVRLDLGMSAGKLAAQVSHAVLGAYRASAVAALNDWAAGGESTIVLQVPDEAALDRYIDLAKSRGLVTFCVHDAGRTEVASGTKTVGAIGPADADQIDTVTGGLSTL